MRGENMLPSETVGFNQTYFRVLQHNFTFNTRKWHLDKSKYRWNKIHTIRVGDL